MPFRLRIDSVEYGNGTARVSGAVVAGAYFGPEAFSVYDTSGREHHGAVSSHGITNPCDWPVVPGDGATLHLTLAWGGDVRIDESRPLLGRGVVMRAPAHVDIDDQLGRSELWAMELGLHLRAPDEEHRASNYFFTPSAGEVDAYYRETYVAAWDGGRWPRLRAPIGEGPLYVEMEASAAIEHQLRHWIGDTSTGHHVLLGYDSGHFSLPSFRPEEVYRLAERWEGSRFANLPLWLMTGSGGATPGPALERFLDLAMPSLPGIASGRDRELRDALHRLATSPSVAWRRDPARGWVNDGRYSQRNPDSSMSILGDDDFAFIERFFEDLGT